MSVATPARARSSRAEISTRVRAPRLDWVLMLAVAGLLAFGAVLVWSATSARDDLTGGDLNSYLKKQLVNIAIGVVLAVVGNAPHHRRGRVLAPPGVRPSLIRPV